MTVTVQSFAAGEMVEVQFMVPRAPRKARVPVWVGGIVQGHHPSGYWVSVAPPNSRQAARVAVTPERIRKPETGDRDADHDRRRLIKRHTR